MLKQQKIYVAGHGGMVGSAIVRRLKTFGNVNVVLRTHTQLDLTDQRAVQQFFAEEKPSEVYLAAAKVGGIHANNTFPAEFIYANLMIQANVIHAAHLNGVRKLLFLGSSCIYPRMATQPMSEDSLLTGVLEPTNEPYAVAKIAGIKLCESYNRQYCPTHGTDYRSVMPTNLYGPGDNYHPENSHVLPGLIRRIHEAKTRSLDQVSIWGTGTPRREFLFVDDMAAASVHVMNLPRALYAATVQPMRSHINVGASEDVSILELAQVIKRIIGFAGQIKVDPSKPDGAPRKLMDSRLMKALGWTPTVSLEQGVRIAYADFMKQLETL